MAGWFDSFTSTADVPLFCVVGSPIAHSKSPLIHAAFAAQTHRRLRYERVEVRAGQLAAAVAEFRALGGRGLNVTVPLKEEAWGLADVRVPPADIAGAANTLWFDARGAIAANTDGLGLVRDLGRNHRIELAGRRILLIGAGGAARGVLPALLAERPASILLTNRTSARAHELVDLFACNPAIEVLPWAGTSTPCDILINATSLSLHGELPPLSPSLLHKDTVCYDMMYGNEPTVFVAWARRQPIGLAIDGLGMLVEQAAAAFQIWHGVTPATGPVIRQLREQRMRK